MFPFGKGFAQTYRTPSSSVSERRSFIPDSE